MIKTEIIAVRVTPRMKEIVEFHAKELGQTTCDFVKQAMRDTITEKEKAMFEATKSLIEFAKAVNQGKFKPHEKLENMDVKSLLAKIDKQIENLNRLVDLKGQFYWEDKEKELVK